MACPHPHTESHVYFLVFFFYQRTKECHSYTLQQTFLRDIYWGRRVQGPLLSGCKECVYAATGFIKGPWLMATVEMCCIWQLGMTWLLALCHWKWDREASGSGMRIVLSLPTLPIHVHIHRHFHTHNNIHIHPFSHIYIHPYLSNSHNTLT